MSQAHCCCYIFGPSACLLFHSTTHTLNLIKQPIKKEIRSISTRSNQLWLLKRSTSFPSLTSALSRSSLLSVHSAASLTPLPGSTHRLHRKQPFGSSAALSATSALPVTFCQQSRRTFAFSKLVLLALPLLATQQAARLTWGDFRTPLTDCIPVYHHSHSCMDWETLSPPPALTRLAPTLPTRARAEEPAGTEPDTCPLAPRHRTGLQGLVPRARPKAVQQHHVGGNRAAFHLKVFNKVPEFFMYSRETYKVNLNSGLNYKAKGCIANNANTAACNH